MMMVILGVIFFAWKTWWFFTSCLCSRSIIKLWNTLMEIVLTLTC